MTNEEQTLWDYFHGNVYDSTRASHEAGRLTKQYMSERKVDYKTAAYELQCIVKNLSNEASFRSYATQEPLIRKHYEAGKVIDVRAKETSSKKPALSIPMRFVSLAGWKLRLPRFTSVMRSNAHL